MNRPHILLLDEPTNAADMEMIDSMAEAIKAFKGGLVLISHDFRLLQQVAEEIWVVDRCARYAFMQRNNSSCVINHRGITRWSGDIRTYKEHLKKAHGAR
jgi:ATP-binding cassette subfamily F protein 2